MKKSLQEDMRGVANVALIVLAVVVIAGAGFAAWRVMKKDKPQGSTVADNTSQAANDACNKETNDKDLCKFFTSWKASEKYRMTSTAPDGSKSVFEVDGNKNHVSLQGSTSYEVVTIDKTTYTKAGDVWYKQTIKEPDQDVSKNYKVDFDEPSDNTQDTNKTTYNKLGKEPCGNLNCFKYEVVDPAHTDEKQFIWFDDKDYQLRRSRSETKDGVTEMTFEYGNVSVSEPSPVKELGPNQYIVPGQTEPITLPTGADGL